jgi:transcriptional regulator GlxA family with amidase domain
LTRSAPEGRRNVGILIFDDVEVLDFAGPYEVFSRTRLEAGAEARRSDDSAPFRVFTVSRDGRPVRATGGLQIVPDHSFESAPSIRILVVPGGFGTRQLLDDDAVLAWTRETAKQAERVTSVCTGSLLLAQAGLLTSRKATTHWGALDVLERLAPDVEVERDVRFVDDGIVTSAGVAAGIDMAFHIVEQVCGQEVADETARYIDYPRNRD